MEGGFQKSWSVYGYRKVDNQFHHEYMRRQDPLFQSGRAAKTNLQRRFPDVPKQHLNADENACPFYLKQQPGLRFRSLTDSDIRNFEVNGVTRSCNEYESPKSSFRQPFRHLPEKIGPFFSNIQHNVSQAGPKTERFFQKGGEKVQKALRGVRTSFSTFSQRFKRNTRRRYQLDNTPTRTPSQAHKITPGKLYSPFDINTPRTPRSYVRGPKRLQYGPSRRNMFGNENLALSRTPQHGGPSQSANFPGWTQFGSPHSARPALNNPFQAPGHSGSVGPAVHQYVNVPRRI